ncbi:hypothetical protein [Nostoc sp.]
MSIFLLKTDRAIACLEAIAIISSAVKHKLIAIATPALEIYFPRLCGLTA